MMEPPRLTIESPEGGSKTLASPVNVTGLINDITVGTVNAGNCHVFCNGVEAEVSNRSFLAVGLPLSAGDNTINCTGTDRAGGSTAALCRGLSRLCPT